VSLRGLFRLLVLGFFAFFLWVYFANLELFRQPLPLALHLPKVTVLFFPPKGIRVDLLLLFSFLFGAFVASLFLGPWLFRSWRSQRELIARVRSLRLKSQPAEEPSSGSKG
jgi:hypothetical protein